MHAAATLACVLVLLAGCANLNESVSNFADYTEFMTKGDRVRGWVPAEYVPRSATHIELVRNIDLNTVRINFDYAAADEAPLKAGFTALGPVPINDLRREELIPLNERTEVRLMVRCPTTGAVEFLELTTGPHAMYWTSIDKTTRAIACRNIPPPKAK